MPKAKNPPAKEDTWAFVRIGNSLYKEIAVYGTEQRYKPVHVDYHKGDISPCVLNIGGRQILGKVDIRNEKASAAFDGEEDVVSGPAIADFQVLCRKARAGYKFD
uniref:DUF1080 domain-containing protein n=1 Tax=Rhabditophanes sp. KR3021 TaxID=114890 RepID=A0AC35U9E0_9BILA